MLNEDFLNYQEMNGQYGVFKCRGDVDFDKPGIMSSGFNKLNGLVDVMV